MTTVNNPKREVSVKYDPERGVYCAHHEWDRANPVYLTVLEAYAAIEGVEPLELPLLSEYIDPTALDDLFGSKEDDDPDEFLSVTFLFGDFEVTVHGTGEILFSPIT